MTVPPEDKERGGECHRRVGGGGGTRLSVINCFSFLSTLLATTGDCGWNYRV